VIDHQFMICFGNPICHGNVVVDKYQHGNLSHHVKFVITSLNCIAAITATGRNITAIITAAIHGGGLFDQQRQGGSA
jgi:hypothetical protein